MFVEIFKEHTKPTKTQDLLLSKENIYIKYKKLKISIKIYFIKPTIDLQIACKLSSSEKHIFSQDELVDIHKCACFICKLSVTLITSSLVQVNSAALKFL